jgi:hypothetical protein
MIICDLFFTIKIQTRKKTERKCKERAKKGGNYEFCFTILTFFLNPKIYKIKQLKIKITKMSCDKL